MKQYILIITILFVGFNKFCYSQELNQNIDRDSLYQTILQDIPEEKRKEFKQTYEEGNEEFKEFLLFMFSMPRSSKKELIENYESNSEEIEILKKKYSEYVPDSLIVSIEFTAENKIISIPESIDLRISKRNLNGPNLILSQEWNLDWESKELVEMLQIIGWNQNTLNKVKELLDAANCISIKNGDNSTTIGFARSGMGKYYYVFFEEKLQDNEIKEFNDGCTYIFYKDKVILEYGGGAVGPQCFPDE